ncbi:MAG TPA: hypothetical protein VGL97_02135 [Bryobacteraceae bacterium]|jgi:hypothetical protein
MNRFCSLFIILSSVMLSACAGPGTKQLLSNIGINSSTSQSCYLDNTQPGVNIFFSERVCDKYPVGTSDAMISASDANTSADPVKIAFISSAIQDSRTKCDNFVKLFTGAQAGENTTLDVISLALSGLGAVFTSANTVRALSAASTGVQGTKQAINSDLFQQMTIMILVQQINTSFYKPLDALNAQVASSMTASIQPSAALATIQGLQRYCSIPFAAANLSTSQTTGNAATSPKYTIAVGGTVTVGDAISLTAKSSATGYPISTKAYTVVAGDTTATIAAKLASATSVLQGFTVSPGNAGTSQFSVQGGPADVSWSGSSTAAGEAPGSGKEIITATPAS